MAPGAWPTADCVAAGCGTVVKVWAPADPASEIKLFEGTPVYSIDFSRNNKVLAVAGDKGQVVVYSNKPATPGGDRAVGRFPALPESGLDAVTCVRFSPNDAHLVGGCKDGSVRVWSLRAKEDERVVSGLAGSATSVAVNHSSEVLASASSSGQVLLHDFRTGAKWKALVARGPAASSLGFSRLAPSRLVAGTAAGQLLLWDLDRLQPAEQLDAHKGAVGGVVFGESGPDLLLSCGADGQLKCTDTRGQQQAAWAVPLRQPLTALSAKHDGRLVAVGTAAGAVLVVDVRSPAQPLSAQQFSDAGCAVTTVRWQHLHASRGSRPASSAATTATAPAPSAAAAAGLAASSRQPAQPPQAQRPPQPAAPSSHAAAPQARGPATAAWPRSPAGSAALTPEGSSTSLSADCALRVVSPVQLYGSPGVEDDAAGPAVPPQRQTLPLHTPEAAVPPAAGGSAALLATPADSLASAGPPPVAALMFTPGFGGLHAASPSPRGAPGDAADQDATPASKPAAGAPPPAAVAAAAAAGGRAPAAAGSIWGQRAAPPLPSATAARAAARSAQGSSAAPAQPSGGGAGASAGAAVPGSGRAPGRPAAASTTPSRRASRASDEGPPASSVAAGPPGAGNAAGPPRPPPASAAAAPGAAPLAAAAAAGSLREDVFKAYVDQCMADLRQDVKSMHLDMLRQFHQAQMDLVSVVDGLAARQDQLAEAVGELAAAVQGLRGLKPQQQGPAISVPWL